jgi:hypothetical protein
MGPWDHGVQAVVAVALSTGRSVAGWQTASARRYSLGA